MVSKTIEKVCSNFRGMAKSLHAAALDPKRLVLPHVLLPGACQEFIQRRDDQLAFIA